MWNLDSTGRLEVLQMNWPLCLCWHSPSVNASLSVTEKLIWKSGASPFVPVGDEWDLSTLGLHLAVDLLLS